MSSHSGQGLDPRWTLCQHHSGYCGWHSGFLPAIPLGQVALFCSAMTHQADKTGAVPYLDLPAQIRGLRSEIDQAIARTLDNCSFCLGPDVVQFEKDFARFCNAEHCVAFNSGTSALHIGLMLLNIGPGDEVISTPSTFVATSWAIS
jgi:cystathionine beta-lyase/cystathionine gamma-synthase